VDVILEWNDIMLQANANDHSLTSPEQGGPILTARAFAIVSAAMYDAYNSIQWIGEPYLVTAPGATGADSDAAVAQAAHDTLAALFPSQQVFFDAALTETLERIPDGTREDQGRAVGAFVASKILVARADDGAAAVSTPTYVSNGLPGFHAADPLNPNQGYYAPGAENITPFAMSSVDHFEARRLDDGTPEGRETFLQSQEYTLAYYEVFALGGDGVTTPTVRTPEQTVIGIYWAYDGRPGLGTPPRLYNQIARTVAVQEGNTEADNARLFALLNLAMADAGLTAWNNKYDDAFWRPILGIRNGDGDGNPVTIGIADWTPLGAPASNPRPGETDFTPPFPAYTSGHATFGAAVFQILTRFYGRDDITFTFVSDEFNGVTLGSDGEVRPVVARTFDSFTEAKLENAQSRIYLGIHWRFDADDGIQTGDQVADYLFDNFLRPASAFRSIDGTGNNLDHPDWGSAGTDLLRIAPAAYADGVSAPAGADRPSARVISNTIADQGDEDILSDRQLSAMIYAFGQFLDHDLDLTPNTSGAQPFNILVPAGDPYFDPDGTGTQVIRLNRSAANPATGTGTDNPLQQINAVTAWLDGSQIYGSDAETADKLRTHVGGRLKTSPGADGVIGTGDDLLPLNNSTYFPDGALPMENNARLVPDDQLFAAGDVRANENVELTSLHTLFVREHNRIADEISRANPNLDDETIYQMARARVIAELQAITYNEWLPALLGPGALAAYQGYNPEVNPGIANAFSTAAFRLGHSLLGDDVEFLDNNGLPVAEEIPLSEAFSNPPIVLENGIDSILKYLVSDPSSELDNTIVNSVRNFLFGPPGAGGFDLASLNIQRGRDHGLADYNSIREAYGLERVTDFDQITSNPDVQDRLRQLYGSVDNIDAWVGALAEDHVPGSSTGPLIRAVLIDQFERLRDGDRFWYQRVFSGQELRELEGTTLADIIRRNTTVTNLQSDVFFFRVEVSGTVFSDRNRDGRRQARERGLADQVVELVNADSGEVVATATTDARGDYRFDVASGLGLGRFQIRVVLPDSSVQTTPLRTVALTRGDIFVTGLDLGVAPAGA
jgi:hypothetical protein